MAEDKKSFILYSDSYGLIKQLPDEIAGRLLKHIFSYVNDENPISDELILNVAFEPIKMQLKRDLIKYESNKEDKKLNGRLGNLKRWNPDLYEKVISKKLSIEDAEIIAISRKSSLSDKNNSEATKNIANIAVNDNVNVSVNDNVTVKEKKEDIDSRKLKFSHTLQPFLETYGKDFLNDFYKYWTEPNKSNSKFRMELEKTWSLERRLETWDKNNKNFNNNKSQKHEQLIEIGTAVRGFNPRK